MLWPFYNSNVVYKNNGLTYLHTDVLTYLLIGLLILLYFTYLLVNVLPKAKRRR